MKAKNIVAVFVLAACALMLVVASSYAYLMALIGAEWGLFSAPTKAMSLLVIIGLPPLALVLGMIWVSKRAGLAGVVVIAGILLSAGISCLTNFRLAQESLIAPLVWIPSGALGLAMMLLTLVPGWRSSGRIAPADKVC